jgi:hypothetical protein
MAEFKEFKMKVTVDTKDGNKEVEKTITTLAQYNKLLDELNKKKVKPGITAEELKAIDKEIENLGKSFTEAGNEVEKSNTAMKATASNLRALKKELKGTEAGTAEFKRLTQQIDDMSDELAAAGRTSKSFTEQLEAAPGPIGRIFSGFERLKGSVTSVGAAFKASGIGLLVAIIGGITAAFAGNEKAAKKFEPVLIGLQKILGGLFRVFEPLLDSFMEMAEVALPYITKGIGIFYSSLVGVFTYIKEAGTGLAKIYQGIFTLDADKISEGVNQIKNSFETAAKSGTDAYKRFTAGTEEVTKIEKENLDERNKNNKEGADKKLEQDKARIDAQIELEKNKANTDAKILEDLLKKKDDLENKGKKLSAEQLKVQEENRKKTAAEAVKTDKDAYDADVENKRKAEDEKLKIVQNNVKLRLEEQNVELERLKILYGEDSKAFKDAQLQIYADRAKALEDEKMSILMKKDMSAEDADRLRQISLEAARLSNEVLINNKKEIDGAKVKFDAQKQLDIEKLDYEMTKAEGDFERQLTLLSEKERLDQESYDRSVLAASGNTQTLSTIEFNYTKTKDVNAKSRIAIKQKETDNELNMLQALANGMNALGDLIGKETAAGKVLSVAASLINTYASIAKQLNAFAGIPVPGYAIAQAIVTGLVGFKAVRDIMTVQVPDRNVPEVRIRKQMGGVLQGPLHSMGGITTPFGELEGGEYVVNRASTMMMRPTLDRINALGGGNVDYQSQGFAGNGMNTQPPIIKTYVVASEMSSQQELDMVIKNRSKF